MPTIINGYDIEDELPARRAFGFAPGAYDPAACGAHRPESAPPSRRAEAAPIESMLESGGEEPA